METSVYSNNFLRLCVLKVTQQSEKHLEKILNVDEFVKRVFSVIHSNDPVARAITLRYSTAQQGGDVLQNALKNSNGKNVEFVFYLTKLLSFPATALFRMLGSLASIIPERKNAHHSIRQSLDSHDNVEVEAAIFAAASFSAQSK